LAALSSGPATAARPIEIVTSTLRSPLWIGNGSAAMRRRRRSATMVATAMSVSGIRWRVDGLALSHRQRVPCRQHCDKIASEQRSGLLHRRFFCGLSVPDTGSEIRIARRR